MFTNPSFLFDIICVVLLLVLALVYAHKGLLATLVQAVGSLASLIGAKLFADWASPLIFERFLRAGFLTRITATITEQGTFDLSALAAQYAGFLPETLRQSIVDSVSGTVTQMVASGAATAAEAIVDKVIEPLFTPVLAIVLFFVAFTVFRMLVSLLVTVLTNVNKIPLVGGVNRALGFFAGLIAGVIDLFLLLCGVWALIVITGGGLPYLNETALGASLFYRLFSRINPFV